MNKIKLKIKDLRPYFAEIPYYLWGMVNYDSDGDCKKPTDRDWHCIYLSNRDTSESITIEGEGCSFLLESESNLLISRTVKFLEVRSNAIVETEGFKLDLGAWNHLQALQRATAVADEFSDQKLNIFDSHLFWGSWKWIGWFGTEFTWVGRWIMLSVLKSDPRGVPLCIDWLKQGTFNSEQSKALRLALYSITKTSFETDKEWINWYDGTFIRKGAKKQFPEPDLNQWHAELEKEYTNQKVD